MRWLRGLGITAKNFTSYILTTVSAAFYAASFLYKPLWFLSFFSLVPVFSNRFLSWRVGCLHGLLWGAIAYIAVLSALLEVMWRLGNGLSTFTYIFVFVGYFVFFTIIWFCLARAIAGVAKSWQVGWLLSSFVYWAWMQIGFFYFITGHLQGYGLALPFVPLMACPGFLLCLPVVQWWGMLFVVLVFHLAVAQKRWWLITLEVLFFAGSYGYGRWQKREEKRCENVVLISGGFSSVTSYERAHEVCEKLLEAERKNPNVQLLVLPESAFPYPLNEHRYAVEMWSNNGKLYEKHLVVGAHYACRECGCLHNSVCVIHEGRVMYRYDKRWMLPFFEEETLSGYASPFLDGKRGMKAGCKQEFECIIPPVGSVVFRICSELLWDMPTKKMVIGLVHDGHYRYIYFSRIFRWYVHMRALENRSQPLYCGWRL